MEKLNKSQMLYKYRKFDHESISMFINKELFFAQPTSFNDPFDGQIDLKYAAESALAELKKMSNIEGYSLLVKLLNEVDLDEMSDAVGNMGVYSLSAKRREVLLWSHYADEHKGFCVGFQQDDEVGINGSIFDRPWKVNYTAKNPYRTFFRKFVETSEDSNLFQPLLLLSGVMHKSSNWRYEEEFRYIRYDYGMVSYPPSMVKEIIFGLKMLPKHKRTIKALLWGPEWQHVTFHQAYRDRHELQLKTRSYRDGM